MEVERVTMKLLRRKLIAWQESNTGDERVPLEIQTLAKELGKKNGYRALSFDLKVDAEKLFADVGMGKRPYKARSEKPKVRKVVPTKTESAKENITITTLSSPVSLEKILITAIFKNGLRVEINATNSSISEILSGLAGVAC